MSSPHPHMAGLSRTHANFEPSKPRFPKLCEVTVFKSQAQSLPSELWGSKVPPGPTLVLLKHVYHHSSKLSLVWKYLQWKATNTIAVSSLHRRHKANNLFHTGQKNNTFLTDSTDTAIWPHGPISKVSCHSYIQEPRDDRADTEKNWEKKAVVYKALNWCCS